MEYKTNELYHHGILGQKWGRKNGPPYPLKASDHSTSEKKAGWKKSLNQSSSVDSKKSNSYNNEKVSKGKSVAKKVLIGVGSVAAVAAIAYVVSSSGSGADKFDDDAYMKSLMLRYSGSTKKKLYGKDGRVIVPHHKFKEVMDVARNKMPSGAKPGDTFQAFHKGYTYFCEVDDDLTPKIVSFMRSKKNN